MHREVSMHESRPEQSAARVACIARSAFTSLDKNRTATNKLFGTHRGTDCRICIDCTSIYYCCKSFPVLLHDVTVGE